MKIRSRIIGRGDSSLAGSNGQSTNEACRGRGCVRGLYLSVILALSSIAGLQDWNGSAVLAQSLKDGTAAPEHNAHGPYRSSVPFLFGGPNLDHEFGYDPRDPARPYNRHYYPYVYGGYAYSNPYFVERHAVDRRDYDNIPYGTAQKRRYYRGYKNETDSQTCCW